MAVPEHRRLQHIAVKTEALAQRAFFAGDDKRARALFFEAVGHYRRSYEIAPPGATGRLIGMLKASVFAEAGEEAASVYAREQLHDAPGEPAEAYALALCGAIDQRDAELHTQAAVMRRGSPPFGRAADAFDALATGCGAAYSRAVHAIVRDFEQRKHHVTKVPIADTALALEYFAAQRGVAALPVSPLIPPRAIDRLRTRSRDEVAQKRLRRASSNREV